MITAAVNGGDLTHADTPYVPLEPKEIAESAIEACFAGAAVVHIHVRDESGGASSRRSLYAEVRDLVQSKCDAILNFSTDLRIPSGLDCLDARPEIASLPVGSVNLGETAISAPLPHLRSAAEQMRRLPVRPELEIFHEGMIGTAKQLVEEGVIPEPVLCQFCLGFDGGAPATVDTLLRMIDGIPDSWIWSAVGLGPHAVLLATTAIALGGHVRVGIEDHPYYRPGELAISNSQLVQRVVRLASEFGRDVASTADVRDLLALR